MKLIDTNMTLEEKKKFKKYCYCCIDGRDYLFKITKRLNDRGLYLKILKYKIKNESIWRTVDNQRMGYLFQWFIISCWRLKYSTNSWDEFFNKYYYILI